MSTETAPTVAFHYYDRHLTAEDRMGENALQDAVIEALRELLDWMFDGQDVFLARNLNIYRERNAREYPVAPDLAVFTGVSIPLAAREDLTSWRMYEPNRPAPAFVLEVASAATWKVDLQRKPAIYTAMGVAEYCLYDPKRAPYLPGPELRLWRRNAAGMHAVSAEPDGRIWSAVLASWVVPQPPLLQLVDADGVRRISRVAAAQRAAIVAERAAIVAQQRAIAEQGAKQRAWAKLRELGIDPRTLED